MKAPLCIAAFILAAFAAQPASANWERTRWGMSMEEVKAAYPAAFEPTDSTPEARAQTPVLDISGPVRVDGDNWRSVRFYFTPDRRLKAVEEQFELPASRQRIEAVRDAMAERYGAPVTVEGTLDPVGSVGTYSVRFVDRTSGGDTVGIFVILLPDGNMASVLRKPSGS